MSQHSSAQTSNRPPTPSSHEPSTSSSRVADAAGHSVIHRMVELDTTLDILWRLVSNPDELSTWLVDSFDVELRVGAVGWAVEGDRRRQVHIDSIAPLRRLGFTWSDPSKPAEMSHVEIEVEGCEDGTSRMSITETLLVDARREATGGPRSVEQIADARRHWEVRIMSLWACTVAMALVQ